MGPLLEKLEDRILLTAEPTATIEGPATVELGQQDVAYTITFDNTSGSDTPDDATDGDVGFSPFVNLLLPTSGGDGDGDGVTFDSATFLGQPITVTEFTFDATGQIEHPVAVDANGDPLIINGTEGDTLLVFELPFGSFSPEQVPVEIDLTLDFSDFANLETVQQLQVTGGFALGGDALDNPDVDPSIVGVTDVLDVTPDLFFVEKTNDGPESETATGPNFPRTWTITIDGADNQNFTNLVIADIVPLNIHYLGNLTITNGGGAIVVEEPDINAVVAPGDQNIEIQIANFTGGTPITIAFDYFIPETFTAVDGAAPTNVLDPVTGDDGRAVNDVSVTADWTPLDPDDDPLTIVSDATPEDDVLELKSIATQKSVAIAVDENVVGFSPGDTIRYTLDVQISDFFAMGDIVLEDVLGDGLDFVDGSARFSVVEFDGDTIADTLFDAASVAATVNGATGETTILFDLSSAMVAAGAADGILVGDLLDAVQEGATTATLTFLAVIRDTFVNPIGDAEVSQGDQLVNDLTVSATVRDNADTSVTVGTEEDTSSAVIDIPFGQVQQKTVAFINGAAPAPDLVISAGDVVTFSVIYVAPEGSYEDLQLDDFLPLPVFDASEITTFVDGAGAGTPPPAGEVHFGAATSAVYFAEGGLSPTLDINATSNALGFDFGTFSVDPREEITIELLFSVTVADAIFGDGLLLTNQISAQEANTDGNGATSTAIDQFIFGQPELSITKGVIASDQGTLDATAGPVAFTAPGAAGQRWTVGDIIDSDGLAITPVDANLDGVDAGDIVSFAIVIENTGSAPNGVFDLRIGDNLPAGFEIGAGGLNLDVRNGAGTALAFTDLGGGIFGAGIELNDGAGAGSLTAFDAASGQNVVVVTYDLVVSNTAGPLESIENTASIDQFSAFEGGNDRVPAVGLTDDAFVTTLEPVVTKVLTSTSIGDDADRNLLVGEIATYTITVTLTEGTTEDVSIRDRIRFLSGSFDINPGLLELLDAEVVSVGANLTSENVFAIGDGPSTAPFDGQLNDGFNDDLLFDFGDVLNTPDGVSNADDQIVIRATALVRDVPDTVAGDRLRNEATLFFEGESQRTATDIFIDESNVSIDKTVSPGDVDGGDEVTFRVEVANDTLLVNGVDRSASAFDLVLNDLLNDADLNLTAGSVVLSGAAAGAATIVTGNTGGDTTIQITLDELATGENLIIEYRATMPDDLAFDATPTNTAALTFDSLPTDDDANERNFDISDVATVDVRIADFTKDIFATSFAETNGADLAIGEEVTFRLTATLPEGAGPIVITDTLPVTPGTLTFLSAEVIEVGADLTGALLAAGATASPVNGVITFDFGDVFNVPDADDLNETIVIEVRARLDDLADNAAGDALVNNAALFFGPDADDVVRDTATVEVVEPAIAIDKIAPAGPVDAGDIVTFTLNIANSGGGPAFDMTVADLLEDTGLALVSGSVTSSDGTATITEVDDGFRVTVDLLDAGDTLQIVYQATVQDVVEFNGSVDNTAIVERFDSNPSDDPADEAREVVFDANNPDADLFDTETVPTVSVTLEKATSVADTNQAETGDGAFDPTLVDLSVGEEVVYTLTIGVPEGQGVLILTDALPDGLIALSAEVTAIAAGVTSANLTVGDNDVGSAAITLAGDGSSVVFDFGLTQSTGVDDPAGAGDLREIQVQVTAIVADVAAATAGAELTNTATLQAFDPIDQGIELTDPLNPTVASETVEVVEPAIAIDKIAPAGPVDAGDIVTFTLNIANSGSGPAFDMTIADLLEDTGLALVSGSVTSSDGTATITEVDDGFRVTVDLLDAGDTLQIVYQATVQDVVEFNGSIENTAIVERFDTNPSDDPADVAREIVFDANNPDTDLFDTESVPTVSVTLDKATSVADTSQTETGDGAFDPTLVDLSVGEEVVYTLTIGVPEGQGVLVLTDALPDGLFALSAEVTAIAAGVTSANLTVGDNDVGSAAITLAGDGSSVVFDFGLTQSAGVDDPAGAGDLREIQVQVTAIVADVAAATAGAELTNTATLQVFDPIDQGVELTDPANPTVATETVEVVEPVLLIDKVAPVAADPGAEVAYELTISHDAINSSGPAFDVIITDALDNPFLTFDSGSVVILGAVGAVVTEVGTGFQVTIPVLEEGDVVTVQYTATLSANAPDAASFPNEATVVFDSVPGDGGREGTDDAEDAVSTVPALQKTLADSSFAETDGVNLGLGEVATFRLEVVLPEILSDGVFVTDTLPNGMTPLAARVISVGGQLAGVGSVADLTVPDIDIFGQTVQLFFDQVQNTADGVLDGGDTIVIEINAVLNGDAAQNFDGRTLTNDAQIRLVADGLELINNDSFDVIAVVPDVSLVKSSDVTAEVDAGDIIAFTVEIQNDGQGPAFQLDFRDLMTDAGLSLVTGSVVSTDGTVAAEVANGDGTLGFTLAIPELGPGETITVTYNGVVTDAAEFNGAIENTAEIASFDTNPLEPGDAGFVDEFTFTSDLNDPNDPLSDTVTATTASVTLEKTTSVADTDQAETGAGEFDPTLVDLSIGEEVIYALTIGVPEGQGVLLLTDALPDGLVALSAEVTAISAGVTTANLAVGDTDVGSAAIILAGDGGSVVFDFGLTNSVGVDDPAGAGDLREIQVQVTAIVADVAAANAGAQLTNTATIQVFDPIDQGTELTDPNAPITASETVEVVEPVLVIEKSADVAADPGDTVAYEVTIAHNAVDSTGPAFNLTVTDALADAFLSLTPGSVTVTGVNGAVVTEIGDGFTITIPVLEEGETVVIRYTALLDAAAPEAASFPNTATVDFSSDPDGDGRTGSETDTEEVATVPALEKSLFASSFAETDGAELGLGEVATFRLEVVLPEVLSDIVTVTDNFPPGLTPLAVRVISVGGQLSGAGSVADLSAPEITIAGQSVTVFFDSVNNLADGVLNDGDTIIIEIDGVMDADAIANANGDVLTNAAEVTLEVGGTPLDNGDTFDVAAVQPELAVTKTASPATDVDAGDIVTFTVQVTNSGDGPAFDLDFQDLLADAGLSLVSGSVVSTDGSTVVETANADGTLGFTMAIAVLDDGDAITITYNAIVTDAAEFNGAVDNVAQIVSFDTNPLEPGDAGFVDEFTFVSDINDANDPLIGRASVSTVAVTLDKATAIGDTDQAETAAGEFDPTLVDVSVGETVVYTFTIGVPEGSGSLILTDTAPAGLTVIAAEVTAIDAGVSTANLAVGDTDVGSAAITLAADGGSVVFDFGLTTSTGVADPAGAGDLRFIEVQVSAIVDDVAAAVAGAQLTNTGVIQVFDPVDGTELTDPAVPTTASETVEVVEPVLIIEKSAPVAAKPGDTVAFEVTLAHDAAASTGPAFDILIADILDNPFLTFDAGTVDVSGVAGAIVTEVDGGFQVTIPVLVEGDVAVIRYTATLAADAPSAEAFANTATVDFDSAPGDGGRAQSDQATDDVSTVPGVNKTLDRSSFAETDGADLGLGETATFRLDVLLPEVLSEGVIVTDTLPEGMTFLAARVVAVGGQLAGAGAVADLAAPQININGQTITLNFDDVDNSPDGVLDAGDVISIEIDAVLTADPAQNPNGDVLTNAANVALTAGGLDLTADDTFDVTAVIPELAVTKAVTSNDIVDEGDVVTYTVDIFNSGDGPAFDLAFEDLMADPRLSLVSGSVVSSDGTVAVEAANADGTLGFTLAIPTLGDGETLTITYSGVIDSVTEFATPIENTARVASFDTNPDEPGDAGFTEEFTIASDVNDPNDPLSDTANVTLATPEFAKTVLTTSAATTGSAEFNPANVDLIVGEIVVYRFEIVLPEGSDNLTLVDQFPTDGAFTVQDVIVTAGANVTGVNLANPTTTFVDSNGDGFADRLTINLGAVNNAADNIQNAGDVITVNVLVSINDNARNQEGDVYTNIGTLTGDAFAISDTETVEIVAPDVTVIKDVNAAQVVDGDIVTFTITVTNDGDATASALDLRITDLIPDNLTLQGDARVSNQVIATIIEGDGRGDDSVIVAIDVLRPGQTVTISYTVSVDEAAGAIRNEVIVTGGTAGNDPNFTNGFPQTNIGFGGVGRPVVIGSFADIFAGPASLPGSFARFAFENLHWSPIDDAQFERVVRIDPIFSGSADYGAGLSLTIFDALGGMIGSRQVMADVGGEWIAHFPLLETGDSADRDTDAFYRETQLFADPTGLLAQEGESIFDLSLDERLVKIGTALGADQFQIRLDDTASTIGDQSGATFNNRLFYAPAGQNELFVLPERLDVSDVFEDANGLTVERLLENARNPLAFGLNRFNAEFLSNSGIPSGM